MALMPKVIRKIVASESSIIHGGTRSIRLLAKTSSSPSTSSGTKLSQNLRQSEARSEIGAVGKIQKAFPSKLTAGKAKRTATALRTKPARARLAKETIMRLVRWGIGAGTRGTACVLDK